MVALLTAGSSAAIAAPVGPVTLSKQNPNDTFDGGGHANVKIKNYDPYTNANVSAGGFRITDGVNNMIAWCLDISHNLSLPASYIETDTPFSNSYGLTGTQQANVEKLFNTNYSGLDLNDNDQSAGFQLALWELVYEKSSSFDVTTGWFSASLSRWSTSLALDYANAFLDNLSGAITGAFNFTYYESVGETSYGRHKSKTTYSQNLISVTPVPLPAAGLLLGCGLMGLYFTNRRVSRKCEA